MMIASNISGFSTPGAHQLFIALQDRDLHQLIRRNDAARYTGKNNDK